MKKLKNKKEQNKEYSKIENFKILSEVTKKDILKTYDIEVISGTEVHYSNRYGWTLRKSNS